MGALDGIKVLDLTRALSGPFCTMILGDLGAQVVKLEPIHEGDMSRSWGPFDEGESVYFLSTNRNKRSVAIDFRAPEGLQLIRRLAGEADVVVNNFKPGVMEEMGLSSTALQSANPKLVFVTITGFGVDGPYGKRAGFDQIAQGMGGLMSITGAPGEGPMRVGIPVADLTAGLFCAMGILTALLEREVSGEGQWVKTSLLQAQIFMLDFQAARWLMDQGVAKQAGNDHPTSIPTGAFKTSDGYINIATAGGRIWERFCQTIGAPQFLTDPAYATGPDRSKNRKALNAEINKLTETKSTEFWVKELNAAGVPCGPIYSIDQVFADEQVKHLGMAADVPNEQNRHVRLVAQPVKLSRTPSKMAARPPEFGEHTEEILAEFGFSGDEIKDLRARKVV